MLLVQVHALISQRRNIKNSNVNFLWKSKSNHTNDTRLGSIHTDSDTDTDSNGRSGTGASVYVRSPKMHMRVTVISGGSRILQRRCLPITWPDFPEKCTIMKKIWIETL